MRTLRTKTEAELPLERGHRDAAFYLFCAFLVSYFTHMTARIDVLGAIHFDLLLAALTALAIVLGQQKRRTGKERGLEPVARQLVIILVYILVTVPFVEWPGSVLHNLEGYLKSVSFFFFVVATVDTTRKLRTLLIVYVSTQLWRVLEPLYMHLHSGYWGSFTSLGNWEYMDRLSGSPYDIINPNGLAFVIIMTLPLLHLLLKPSNAARKVLLFALVAAMCYALVLSASRSGFLGAVFLGILLIWRSKNRVAYLAGGAIVAIVTLSLMTDLQRERYVSIFSSHAKGAATAEARVTGVIGDFKVSLRRPIFGHGLGTSREANANFRGEDLPSHNLYTEVAEELGYVGLVLLLMLIYYVLRACSATQQIVNAAPTNSPRLQFLHEVSRAMVVLIAVDLFFSFAAFGFSEPYWYFYAGLVVATARLAVNLAPAAAAAAAALRSRRVQRVGGNRGRAWATRQQPRARTR